MEHWYKEAIIYELHVKCFYDSSGDGIGDFKGLTQKLDYLQDLGVTAIWLLPFYPSPLKDDGYDIADFINVHPYYGDLKDFRDFLREAHLRGLKVITELVINHTSDQHPLFQKARRAEPGQKARDFYVWSETAEKYEEARIIFQDFEHSNWAWDREAESYYWHRFYSHQPDLNFDHPEVHKMIFRYLNFWFKMGVDGMRLDAIPYLYEREGTNCENLPETHGFLKKLRAFVDAHFQEKMLLAEANQWPEDAAKYFGSGDECHMAFHFPVMPRLFMAIHLEDSLPIIEIMGQTPDIPENCQWALFLRNHDELTLEMVTDEERDYMWRVYAYDTQARINLGIRRRLAPLLKNDRRKIELMNALLFSITGTPVLYYGDELGMGDNIYLGDRNGVRTPMQWSSDKNAGFSRANPQRLYLPPIVDAEYHYETVNVEAQLNNPYSLLWWTKQLIALRKRYKAFSYGKTDFLAVENRKVLVFLRKFENELILIVANFSRFPQYVEIDLKPYVGYNLVEMFSGERFPSVGEHLYLLTLGSYGYYWFSLEKQPQGSEIERISEKSIVEITLRGEAEHLFLPSQRRQLESIVKKYLIKKNWISSQPKMEKAKIAIVDHGLIDKEQHLHLIFLTVTRTSGIVNNMILFTHILAEKAMEERLNSDREHILALCKEKRKNKILLDVGHDRNYLSKIIFEMIQKRKRIKTEQGEIKGVRLAELENCEIKVFTRMDEGVDPDLEIRLFLMRQAMFKGFIPIAGYVEYANEQNLTLAIAEKRGESIYEQEAKELFLEGAMRFLQQLEMQQTSLSLEIDPSLSIVQLAAKMIESHVQESMADLSGRADHLGKTTAEFHSALSNADDNVNFSPIQFNLFYQRSIYQMMRKRAHEAFVRLAKLKSLDSIYPLRDRFIKCLNPFINHKFQICRYRCHGNYILENVSCKGNTFYVHNFGESRALLTHAERRYKRCVLRDVAAMLFSITQTSFDAIERLHARGLIKERVEAQKRAFTWSLWIGSVFTKSYLAHSENTDLISSNMLENDYLIGIFVLNYCIERLADPHELRFDAAIQLLQHWLPIYEEFKFN